MAKKPSQSNAVLDTANFFGAAESREVSFTAGSTGNSINITSKVDINGRPINVKIAPANNGLAFTPAGKVSTKVLPYLGLISIIANELTPEVKTKWVQLPKNLMLNKEKALEIPELVERATEWFSQTDKPMPNFAYKKVLPNGINESVVAKVEERADRSGNKFKVTIYYKQLDNHPIYLTRVSPTDLILTEEDLENEITKVAKHNEAIAAGTSKANPRKVRFFKNPYDANDQFVYMFSDSKESLYFQKPISGSLLVGKKLSEAGAESKDKMFLLITASNNKLVTKMRLTSHGAASFTSNKMQKKIKELPEHIGLGDVVLRTQLVDWDSRCVVRIESEAGNEIFGENPSELVYELRYFKAPRTARAAKAAIAGAAKKPVAKRATRNSKPAIDKQAAVVKNVDSF